VIGGGPARRWCSHARPGARAARSRARRAAARAQRRDEPEARGSYDAAYRQVLLQKQLRARAEFDAIHTVERALEVGRSSA
jgi:hypothetical protein